MPVSIVFDRGIGDIFSVRVAGNILGEMGTASIEYAIEYLGVRLIAVLGHSSCGAVQAAMAEASHSVSIRKLIEKITPAAQKTIAGNVRLAPKELVDKIARGMFGTRWRTCSTIMKLLEQVSRLNAFS